MTAVPASSMVLVDAPALIKPSAMPAADVMPSLTSRIDARACSRRASRLTLLMLPRTQLTRAIEPPRPTDDGRALAGPAVSFRGSDGDVVIGGRGVGCPHVGGDRGGLEPLDDQPHAQRELPGGYREGRDRLERGDMPDAAAEQRGDDGGEEQGGSDEPDDRDDPRHEPGPVHQGAEQQGVDARHEGLPEQHRPVVDRDVRRASRDERGRIGTGRSAQVVPQGHQREQAEYAGEDHGGFEEAGGDEAEREAFVLPLDHRVQRDGGADAGQRDDHLQEAAHQYARVGAGAEDPVPVVLHRAVEGEGGDRDKSDQVEDARDQRGLSQRGHPGWLGGCGVHGGRHIGLLQWIDELPGLAGGHSGWPASTWVTETSGTPRSRTFWSKPCSADWSATGPQMMVVPSVSLVRLSPSNQAAHRESRCPLRRISYRPGL